MLDSTCAVAHCIHPTSGDHIVCDYCWTNFNDDIKWLTRHVADLEYRLNKAYGKTGQGGGGTVSTDPMRQPIHTLLYETDEHGNDGLEILLHVYLQSTNLGYRWDDPMEVMHQRLNRLLDSPDEEKVLLGPCPAPSCDHQLSAGISATEVRCDYCRNTWTVNYLRKRQHDRLLSDDTTATQTQLIELLALQGIVVKPGTLRKWVCEGDIKPVEFKDGHKLYRLGDVYGRSARMVNSVWDMPKVQGK